jgi:hypothetical protein
MRLATAFTLPIVLLAACATTTSPIPENYAGPLATVKDSVKPSSTSKADFFYLSDVDGRQIANSRIATRVTNQGRGMYMKPVVLTRQVPAQASRFTIFGRTEYAAPILALTSTVYQVTGEIQITPEPDKTYVVKGELGENYSAVWVEEEGTGRIIGEKVEVKGSAALGMLQK